MSFEFFESARHFVFAITNNRSRLVIPFFPHVMMYESILRSSGAKIVFQQHWPQAAIRDPLPRPLLERRVTVESACLSSLKNLYCQCHRRAEFIIDNLNRRETASARVNRACQVGGEGDLFDAGDDLSSQKRSLALFQTE